MSDFPSTTPDIVCSGCDSDGTWVTFAEGDGTEVTIRRDAITSLVDMGDHLLVTWADQTTRVHGAPDVLEAVKDLVKRGTPEVAR